MSKTIYFINRASGWIHSAGAGILALMMFVTFVDVALRYVFNRPLTGSYELTVYMMSIVIAFGLAYCAVLKGHITVDIVVSHFSQRSQAIIDSITSVIGLGFFSVVTWQCTLHIKEQFDSGLRSSVLLIPEFPFVGAVALGSAMFCLVLLTHFVEFISQAVRK